MILRGIDFGHVFNSSGARGFFGEGWWFHWIWRIFFFFGFKPERLSFKSKTATRFEIPGNMPKGKWAWLKSFFPACVVVSFLKQVVLNAVGLTNIGIDALIQQGLWQKQRKPFAISIMAIGSTKAERLREIRDIVEAVKEPLRKYPHLVVALEINVSCPNTQHDPKELSAEVLDYLKIASELNLPIIVKLNIFASLELVKSIQESGLCDAINITNTIPWWSFWRLIPWKKLFGSKTSPLIRRGFKQAGGLSGPWVFPFLVNWIYRMRMAGVTIPFVAGGGIMRKQDILLLRFAGANAVEFGVGHFMFRPWAMDSDRQYAEHVFSLTPDAFEEVNHGLG